jgi:hypothetical protein
MVRRAVFNILGHDGARFRRHGACFAIFIAEAARGEAARPVERFEKLDERGHGDALAGFPRGAQQLQQAVDLARPGQQLAGLAQMRPDRGAEFARLPPVSAVLERVVVAARRRHVTRPPRRIPARRYRSRLSASWASRDGSFRHLPCHRRGDHFF